MTTRVTREEQYYLLKARAERRANDPMHLWQPHPKQQDFINSVLGTECYENYAFWANRTGKTDVGALCGSHLARYGLPDAEIKPAIGASGTVVWDRATSGWVAGVTANFVRDVIAPKYFDNGFVPAGSSHKPFIPDREIDSWRPSDKILRLKNGSIIGFKAYADGRLTFQGAGKDWVHLDEEPPKDIATEVSIRVEAGRRLRMFYTCTLLPPEGQVGGVTWLYDERVKPFLDGKPCHWKIFQASIYDNSNIAETELRLLEAKYPEGSIERRIRLNGELLPGIGGARAYGAFQYGLHVSDTGYIEPRRPLCWMLDFNVEPMVSLVGQRHGRIFKVHRELYMEVGSVMEMGRLFRAEFPEHKAELWIYGDASGKGRDAQTGRSDYQLLMNELRGYPVPIKLKIPDKNPNVPDRVNAVNRALKDEYGEIGVQIDPSCTELIKDLEDVQRDNRGGIKKTSNRSDPYFWRTHTSDAFGYWIYREQPVTSEPIRAPLDRQTTPHISTIKVPSYGFQRKPGL